MRIIFVIILFIGLKGYAQQTSLQTPDGMLHGTLLMPKTEQDNPVALLISARSDVNGRNY